MKCCGVNGVDDWKVSNQTFSEETNKPAGCCMWMKNDTDIHLNREQVEVLQRREANLLLT